jgi:hypothetical protein
MPPKARIDHLVDHGFGFYFIPVERDKQVPPSLDDKRMTTKNGKKVFKVSLDEFKAQGEFVDSFEFEGIKMHRIALPDKVFVVNH